MTGSFVVFGSTFCSKPQFPRNRIHSPKMLVIDTDGGADDATAVMLALSSQYIGQVLGITCVFGDTDVDNACQNALRFLTVCDSKGIPVYKGSPVPLEPEITTSEPNFYGSDGLFDLGNEFSTGGLEVSNIPAAVALTQMAISHPGMITLLAIGPLTNVALAHRIDPNFTSNLKEIVVFGGNYNGIITDIVVEFNFRSDPLAANIVLSEAACPVTIVPYETTVKNAIPWDKYREASDFDTKKAFFFHRVTASGVEQDFRSGHNGYYDFDFLAACAAIYPESVTSQVEQPVTVEYEGKYTRGQTVILQDTNPGIRTEVHIVTDFNSSAIQDLLFRMVQ